jgi:membrane associated rhomboid family serine protease
MEKSIGSIRFFLVYISSGIFGFVMGGNFAATGIASTGASGSLFGIIFGAATVYLARSLAR